MNENENQNKNISKNNKNSEQNILVGDTYELNVLAANLTDIEAELEKEKAWKAREAREHEHGSEKFIYKMNEPHVSNVKNYIDNYTLLPKIAIDLINRIINYIKSDMSITGFNSDTPKDARTRAFATLRTLRRFKSKSIQKEGLNLEEVLIEYIDDLKEYNLYPSLEWLERELVELRNYKIDFFKAVLEEYRKDPEHYDRYLIDI